MSLFGTIEQAPADSVFGVQAKYQADPNEQKIDLSVGAYRGEDGKPWVLPSVREAERRLLREERNKEYLAMDGFAPFRRVAADLLFGELNDALRGRIATVQSISGTGALRLAAEYLARKLPGERREVYVTNPTWGNHPAIFEAAGLRVGSLKYYDAATCGLAETELLSDLSRVPNGSIIVLHTCAHNPTGVDPTPAQWDRILDVLRDKHHVPLFDTAYQGFATGDLAADAYVVRSALARGQEFVATQSFAKNMGLYSERVGACHFVVGQPELVEPLSSQLKVLARTMYSNPPSHGAYIVTTILQDPALRAEWLAELAEMSGRIRRMREALHSELVRLGTPGSWDHVVRQIGMFSYTGLRPEACDALTAEHHIYLLRNGRISIPGLTSSSVLRVAHAIHRVLTKL